MRNYRRVLGRDVLWMASEPQSLVQRQSLMQSQRLVTTTTTSGHDLPKLLLVLVPDSYEMEFILLVSPSPSTPNSIVQFSNYSLKQVEELVTASLSWPSEPGWQVRRINALNLDISGLEWLHCKLIVSYLNNIRILSFPSESPQLQYFCAALQTLIRVLMKCSWFEVKSVSSHEKN